MNNNQYNLGNDVLVPESAFESSSYIDGMYTQFVSGKSWGDVQSTYKLNLPQSAWADVEDITAASAAAYLSSGYNTATVGTVTTLFPNLAESGRSEYVNASTEESTDGTTEESTDGTTEESTDGTTEESTDGTTEDTAE